MRPHAELVVLCAGTADRLERSGICADVLGTAQLLREAGARLAALADDHAAAERLVLELRQERAATAANAKPRTAGKKKPAV